MTDVTVSADGKWVAIEHDKQSVSIFMNINITNN